MADSKASRPKKNRQSSSEISIRIAATGVTKFGELWDKSLVDLAVEAAEIALASYQEFSGSKAESIDALYFANMTAGLLGNQEHLGALLSRRLGLKQTVPAIHVEAACASGGVAIHQAQLALKSGQYQRVLVVGAEKMTDASAPEVTQALAAASDWEWEGSYGVTFPALYAMIAREYFAEYGAGREDLARVSVKNHCHALENPKAQFRREFSVEAVLAAPVVASPLGLLDCSPISDGAAAVVMSSLANDSGPELVGSAQAQDYLALHERESLTRLAATEAAATAAYVQAGISPNDIDIAEVHDCFTIAELLAYEDLGFCERGEASELLKSGKTSAGGELPVNLSGGLKACGHPVGATGVKQVAEIADKLNNSSNATSFTNNDTCKGFNNYKIGLAHNVGGSGATAAVNILAKYL